MHSVGHSDMLLVTRLQVIRVFLYTDIRVKRSKTVLKICDCIRIRVHPKTICISKFFFSLNFYIFNWRFIYLLMQYQIHHFKIVWVVIRINDTSECVRTADSVRVDFERIRIENYYHHHQYATFKQLYQNTELVPNRLLKY